jgi:hypothetical protein
VRKREGLRVEPRVVAAKLDLLSEDAACVECEMEGELEDCGGDEVELGLV